MPQIRKSRSRRNYKPNKQQGGFSNCGVPAPSMPQKGGSPASNSLMNDATKNPPVVNDYIVPPRIRDSWYDATLSNSTGGQSGGSLASDLVNENITKTPETKPYDAAWSPKGDMNSLNLYETTGGARRRRRSYRKNSKRASKRRSSKRRSSKRRISNNRSVKQRGGGSDWIMSQYSLGPSNNPEQSAGWVGNFSASGATSRADYMNPSTLGLAGSGAPMGSLEGANVRQIGSPLV
jgi:hypothetical protein